MFTREQNIRRRELVNYAYLKAANDSDTRDVKARAYQKATSTREQNTRRQEATDYAYLMATSRR
jgi:hypothetical protein